MCVCVQRVLWPENVDYDAAISGVTRHYVYAAPGSELDRVVCGLYDADVRLLDASAPVECIDTNVRELAHTLVSMLVSALADRETGRHAEVPRRRPREVPVVETLAEHVWHPRLAAHGMRQAPRMLLLQYFDNDAFMARVNAFLDATGIDVESGDSGSEGGGSDMRGGAGYSSLSDYSESEEEPPPRLRQKRKTTNTLSDS